MKGNKEFKVDRLQIIVVAKNITVLQLFISRMPKMCAIPQLVSAPLNPIPTVEHFRRSNVSTVTDNIAKHEKKIEGSWEYAPPAPLPPQPGERLLNLKPAQRKSNCAPSNSGVT